MGNDHQINHLIKTTKESFLSVPFASEPPGGEIYDLEKEFAATKKNRGYFVTFLMLGFFTIVALGVWLLYAGVEQGNQKFEVQVADFEELRIREAFDALQKDRASLVLITREIQEIRDQYSGEEQRIRLDLDSKKENVKQSGSLSIQADTSAIEAEGRALLAALQRQYEPKIAEKEAEFQGLNAKIVKQETELGPALHGREAFVNNQQKLFEKQKESIAEFYEGRLNQQRTDWNRLIKQQERARTALIAVLNDRRARELAQQELKYNPKIQDPAIQALMVEEPLDVTLGGLKVPELTLKEGVTTREYVESLSQDFQNHKVVLNTLRQIPYINSIPGMLEALDRLNTQARMKTEALFPLVEKVLQSKNDQVAREQEIVNSKNQEIEKYHGYLSSLATKIGGAGFVLESLGGRDYRLLLKDGSSWKPGDMFKIVRIVPNFGGSFGEMEVGELELSEQQDLWIGKLTSQKQVTILPEIQDKLVKK